MNVEWVVSSHLPYQGPVAYLSWKDYRVILLFRTGVRQILIDARVSLTRSTVTSCPFICIYICLIIPPTVSVGTILISEHK